MKYSNILSLFLFALIPTGRKSILFPLMVFPFLSSAVVFVVIVFRFVRSCFRSGAGADLETMQHVFRFQRGRLSRLFPCSDMLYLFPLVYIPMLGDGACVPVVLFSFLLSFRSC